MVQSKLREKLSTSIIDQFIATNFFELSLICKDFGASIFSSLPLEIITIITMTMETLTPTPMHGINYRPMINDNLVKDVIDEVSLVGIEHS